jgi:hypothetical protein
MARREALPDREWPAFFRKFVDDATRLLGKTPCIALDADENGSAELTASIARNTKTVEILNGHGKITYNDVEGIRTRVYRSEILAVLVLLEGYVQPDPEFDANLECWREWLPAEDEARADLGKWL